MTPIPLFGIYVPQFRPDSSDAVDTARLAESLGVDGVFVLDHLWAPGNRDRLSLPIFPLLADIGEATTAIRFGTLVAKVGLLDDAELVNHFFRLAAAHGGRLIGGLGTGDANSLPEYEAAGVVMAPMEERRRRLRDAVTKLIHAGVEVWVGGLSDAIRTMAADCRATLNLWQPADGRSREAATDDVPWTWAGAVEPDVDAALPVLRVAVQRRAQWLVPVPIGVKSGEARVRFAVECRAALQASLAERPLA